MGVSKVAVSLDEALLREIDKLVTERRFLDRDRAIQIAVQEKIGRLNRSRFLEECAMLDPEEEKAFAEEGMAADGAEWPRY